MSGERDSRRSGTTATAPLLARWHAVHETQIGASHVREGLVCQDASASQMTVHADGSSWALIAVADGHGSDSYFRSDRGAKFAVYAMQSAALAYHSAAITADENAPRVDWDDWARRHVVARWRQGVVDDLLQDPPRFGGDEAGVSRYFDRVRAREGWSSVKDTARRFEEFADYARRSGNARQPLEQAVDPERFGPWQLKAYGTTLLGVLISPEALHWLAIGDGAIVVITGGEPSYLVEPPSEAIANETPSLCAADAIRSVRAGTVDLRVGPVPSAIVTCTDGVANSYETLDGFFQFCVDIARVAEPTEGFQRQLAEWLSQISHKGSGDDMSVAMAWADEPPTAQGPSDEGLANDEATLVDTHTDDHHEPHQDHAHQDHGGGDAEHR